MTSVIKYVFTVVKVVDQTFNPSLLAAAFLHPSLLVLYLPIGKIKKLHAPLCSSFRLEALIRVAMMTTCRCQL